MSQGSANTQALAPPGKSQPSSITPPSMLSAQPSPGMPTSSAETMPNMSSMSPSMTPAGPDLPPNPMTSTGMTSASIGYGPAPGGSGMIQSSATLPQLQHVPLSAQNPMVYPTPQSQPTRSGMPPAMVGPLAGMTGQSQVAPHASQMPQHMMSQGGQQSSQQQYLMQQRQMQQYRQSAPQQVSC